MSQAGHGRARRMRCCAAAFVLISAACAAPDGAPADSAATADGRRDVRIVLVTHGQAADPFWSVVANGARDAGRDLGVRVEYQAPVRFDLIEMSQRIDAARASQPAALIVSIPDGNALGGAIRATVASGIPVLSINSGDDVSGALGALAHIGQPEYAAGYGAGERLAALGVTHALCVNHEVGNLSLDRRCDGLRDALARTDGVTRVLAVDLADPDDAEQRVAGAIATDDEVNGILTLGPNGIAPTLAALAGAARGEEIVYGTFDLTPAALDALEAGRLHFAIDQQPYLQGYLPVVFLVKYLETRTMPGGGRVIATGPAFVTGAEAAAVRALVERGIR